MIKVLFVCLGNICRSPMADGIFQQLVRDAGLADQILIDSAGTGDWHVGQRAHQGTEQILREKKIPYDGRARQVEEKDMSDEATYVIAMDQQNMADLVTRFGAHPRLYLMLQFGQHAALQDVPDPYYTKNFDYVYEIVADSCRGLLTFICAEEGLS